MTEHKSHRRLLVIRVLLVSAMAGILIGSVYLAKTWPFTRDAVMRDLQSRLKGRLSIGQFRQTWFPPGFEATDLKVVYPDAGENSTLITARHLFVRTSYSGVLSRAISKIRLDGVRITVPPDGLHALFSDPKSNVKSVSEMEVNDAAWISPKLRFRAKRLVLRHIGGDQTVRLRASLLTEKPNGELRAEGQAGPFKPGTVDSTPMSGTFQYLNADLRSIDDLHGVLSARGSFDGALSGIHVNGTLSIPDFEIDGSHHSVHLIARYDASVNPHNADVRLRHVEAQVDQTTIVADGNILGGHGQHGKTARVQLSVNQGRVEDLLNYFSQEQKASMTGSVQLHAFAEVPPGPHFLKKLLLTGDFTVQSGKFTHAATQKPVNALAASAEDKAQHIKEPKEAEADRTTAETLRGHVFVRDGLAKLDEVSLEFPGAIAKMTGTFQLISRQVDVHGTLRTTGSLPHVTSGFREFFLKFATPFLKKTNATVVAFAITGTASNPQVNLDLSHRQKF